MIGHWSGAILTDEHGVSVSIEEGTEDLEYADVTVDEDEWQRLTGNSHTWSQEDPAACPSI